MPNREAIRTIFTVFWCELDGNQTHKLQSEGGHSAARPLNSRVSLSGVFVMI